MITPFRDAAEGLFLPAERARRGWFYLGLVLAGMLCLVLVEGLMLLVIGVLIKGEDVGFIGRVGVIAYAALPVIGGAVTLVPMIVLVRRQPGLGIDSTGVSKVWRGRTETVRWADIGEVRFNSRRNFLLVVLKAGVRPGQPNIVGGEPLAVLFPLGSALWLRRRPGRADLIVEAVERFAPGVFTVEPWSPDKGGAQGAGAPA